MRSRHPESDPLALNSTTMHQYYSTVQSDEASDHLLVDAAMSRRQAMALHVHRRQAWRPNWLVMVGVVVLVAACGVWLLR